MAHRIIHAALLSEEEPQTSQVAALRALGGAGYRQIDLERSGLPIGTTIEAWCREWSPTLVFLQIQRAGHVGPHDFLAFRRAAPAVKIVTWCGDVAAGVAPHPRRFQWCVDLAKEADSSLWTSMAHVELLRARGVSQAGYLQVGFDEDRYFPAVVHRDEVPVTFLYRSHHSQLATSLGEANETVFREALGKALRKEHLGAPIGHAIHAANSGDLYRRSRYAVSASITSRFGRYSSDRLLRALACGVPVLVKRFADMEHWGLEHGKNCYVFDTVEECVALTRREPDPEVGTAGSKLAYSRHTWSHRMRELEALLAGSG